MTTARSSVAAVTSSFDNRLYVVDGQTGSSTYTGVNQAYSISGNAWSSVSADTSSRAGAAAGAITVTGTNYLYSYGGYNGSYQNRAAYYIPASNSWRTVANLPTARAFMGTAIGSNGWVYTAGGQSSSGYVSTVEAYSYSASAWYCSTTVIGCTSTPTPPIALPTARANFTMVEDANGLIYAIGGQTGVGTYTNVVEAYNPSTRSWACSTGDTASRCSSATLTPMPTARAADGDTTSNGLIYVIGGSNGTNLSVVEVYNPSTNSWACSTGDAGSGCSSTILSPQPTARSSATVALGSDGQLYVLGGFNGTSYLSTVEAYQPPATPGAPTGVSAVAGSATATVSWTAPSSTGGMPITGYTITCTPSCGSVSAGASATAAVVTGLSNGTAYTFTVVATNFVGSSSGGTSASVTPSACTSGSPTISGATPGSFSVTLNGSDQVAYSTLSSYSATDNACGGWNVTFQSTRMTCTAGQGSCPAGGDSLPASSLVMAPPTVACHTGTSCLGVTSAPSISISSNTALDSGSAVKIASAAANTGEGTYDFTPTDISGSGTPLKLSVPSYAYTSTYSSTLTVSIVSGP